MCILYTVSISPCIYSSNQANRFRFDNNGSNGFDELPQNDSQLPFNIVHRNVQRTIFKNENCSVERTMEKMKRIQPWYIDSDSHVLP